MPPGPHSGNRNRPAYSGQPRFRFPKQIIQLFAPRKPLQFKPPPRKPRLRPMTGLAQFTQKFSKPPSTPQLTLGDSKKKSSKDDANFETPAQRRQRVKREKQEHVTQLVKKDRLKWDPTAKPHNSSDSVVTTPATDALHVSDKTNDPKKLQDDNLPEKTKEPYSTIFVWNIPKTSIELSLQDEFESFGPVRTVVMPVDNHGLPRGYAFIEYEHERDADVAVRQADGIRFEGRRLRVDVERGRTVKGWFPNRLDGQYNSCALRRK